MQVVKTRKRPLRMSAEFVRAILSGDKTEHREMIVNCACNCEHRGILLGDWSLSTPPHKWDGNDSEVGWNWQEKAKRPVAGDFVEVWQTDVDDHASGPVVCPFGNVGDKIWIRDVSKFSGLIVRLK
jgi:hypothetical protein